MAIRYVDNVLGNDANSGLTPALAKASITAFAGSTVSAGGSAAGDTIRVKNNPGVPYTVTSPAAAWFLSNACLWDKYIGDSDYPEINYVRTNANSHSLATNTLMNNLSWVIDWGTDVNAVSHLRGAGNVTINNCKFKCQRTGGSASAVNFVLQLSGTATSTIGTVTNSYFEGDDGFSNMSIQLGTPFSGGSLKCVFTNNVVRNFMYNNTNNGIVAGANIITRNIFDGISFGSLTNGSNYLFSAGNSYGNVLYSHNNIHIKDSADNATGNHFVFDVGNTSGPNGTVSSNIVTSTEATKTIYMYRASASAYPDNIPMMIGNNAYYGLSLQSTNTAPSATFREDLGNSINLTGMPYLSQTYGNANYYKVDTASSHATPLLGTSIYGENIDIGRYQSAPAGSGETDPNKVANTSTVVAGNINPNKLLADDTSGIGTLALNKVLTTGGGTINPNTVMASNPEGTLPLNEVRATSGGTIPSNKIAPSIGNGASYNGSETNDAIVASELPLGVTKTNLGNVIVGTDVGAATNDLLTSADLPLGTTKKNRNVNVVGNNVGEAFNDVILASELESGVSKLNRNVTVNGTNKGENFNSGVTADKIKIGESVTYLGNIVTGTADCSELYTDIDLTKVNDDYSFRYNSLVNNRTGTNANKYALVPLDKLQKDYEQVAGFPGSDVGALFNDVILASELESGVTKLNRNVSVTGTNKGENFNSVLTASELKSGLTKLNRGNTINGTDKGEDFNSVISPSVIKSGNSIQNLGNTINGTDKGEDFNDEILSSELSFGLSKLNLGIVVEGTNKGEQFNSEIPEDKVEKDYDYLNLGEEKTGSLVGGSVNPKYIQYPLGDLGKINESGMDVSIQIANQFYSVLEVNLTDYKLLDHLENVGSNSLRQNDKRYGIRLLDLEPINGLQGVIGREVIERRYEVILTTGYAQTQFTDKAAQEAKKELIKTCEKVRRLMNKSDFGLYNNSRLTRNIIEQTIEIDTTNHIVIARIQVAVQAKLPS